MRIIQGELIYKGSNYRGVVGGLETMRDIVRTPSWLTPCSRAHSNNPRLGTRVRRMKGGPQA